MEQTRNILVALLIFGLIYGLSIPFFLPHQAALLGIIGLLVTLWTNQGLPLAVVSLLPIILFPSFDILSTAETTSNYAKPIIFLFLGGFLLAIAVEKTRLHQWLADHALGFFPRTARGMIFAMMITSGLLSSLLSNSTTTLLLLPIALFLSEKDELKRRFVLAIAYGASIGGILTPIGTPPNLILLGIMEQHGLAVIPFIQWVVMVAPIVGVMMVVGGWLLGLGVGHQVIMHQKQDRPLSSDQKRVLLVLIGTIVLLVANAPLEPYHSGFGLSEPGILLGAGLLLFAPPFSILTWEEDRAKIAYRIIFLFGAGFAIAMAFSQTGMAKEIASSLETLSTLPIILFVLVVAFMVTFTTEITSNTALISIMLPILYAVTEQTGMDSTWIMMIATVCASYAFMLPIATPPNAIAMSSGVVSVKTMASYGIFLNLAGILTVVLFSELLWRYWL